VRGHQRIEASSYEHSRNLIENGKVVYNYLAELNAIKKVVINLSNEKEKNSTIERMVNSLND